ncbi:MAG: hypothetical protein FWH22_10340 [Fibromonadales bacterium]|nr:hypothetical protein [Fibromonadales bacterium]
MEKDVNFLLDPDNIPGVDYYLEIWKQPGKDYPKCQNHAEELTVKGFCNAANALAKPFSEALKKAREINRAR